MFIEILMSHTKLKPIIEVQIISGVNKIPVQALIDTGSSKAFWVDSKNLFRKFTASPVKDDGTASGLGLYDQTNCLVSTMNINIRGLNKSGIRFNDVPITCANVKNAGLFSLILPYTLFNGFEFGFKPDEQNEFGNFYLNTYDNKINYKTITGTNDIICGSCVCSDGNTSDSCSEEDSIKKVTAF